MSYHPRSSPRGRAMLARRVDRLRRRPVLQHVSGLGDLIDDARRAASADATQAALSKVCDPVGQAAQAPYDAQLAAINAAWTNRDDFYYVGDMQSVITAAYNMITQSQALLDNFTDAALFSSTPQNALFDAGKTGQQYVDAMNAAKQAGAAVVDAPGFRGWVIDVWSAAGEVAYLIGYAKCTKPAIVTLVQIASQGFMAAFDLFTKAVRGVAVVAYDAGQIVYHAATGAVDLLKYAKVIALGVGAVWLLGKLKEWRR